MLDRDAVLRRLDDEQIPHETWFHEAAHTMEDCLRLPFAGDDVAFCKNILLCNRQQTEFYLYITLPDKPFRTADVSKLLGVSRLSFAPNDDLPRLCGLQSGSLSPLALWQTEAHAITLALDREITQHHGRIAFHPCENTATVIFTQEVFRDQVLPSLGHEPRWLDVPWPQPKAE